MKKLFVIIVITSLLCLEGCYYSKYVSTENNYYEDTSHYSPAPNPEPEPSQPIVIIVPQPYPVPEAPTPATPIKYRPGASTGNSNPTTNPDAYRDSKRGIDMTNVNLNHNVISSQPAQKPNITPEQNGTGFRDTKNTLRNGNSNRGNEGERGR